MILRYLLASLVLLSGTVNAAEPTSQAKSEAANMACTMFPPYKIARNSVNRPHSGIDLDVIRAAFAVSNRSVKFEFYPWKRTVKMTKAGQADALCGCAYRPEREQHFLYSDMLGLHSQGVFVNSHSGPKAPTSLDDLAGFKVGAVRGYAVHTELSKRKDIEVVEAGNDRELLRLLQANRVDAIYSYRDIILYRMALGSDHRKIQYFEFSSQPYYLCFSKQKPNMKQLVDDFNKGLRMIRFTGQYQAIWQSYR